MNAKDLLLRRRMMMDGSSPLPPPPDMSRTPLTFEAIEDGTGVYFLCEKSDGLDLPVIEYSLDGGETWTEQVFGELIYDEETDDPIIGEPPVVIDSGEKISFRCINYIGLYEDNISGDYMQNYVFCDKQSYVYGNMMSIVAGSNFVDAVDMSGSNFASFFDGWICDYYTEHPQNELLLPATILSDHCYQNLFAGCTGLTKAPRLPATTLAEYCYHGMFSGCVNLRISPELPATELRYFCYSNMFSGCTSLEAAPELPAITLSDKFNNDLSSCYVSMFQGCTSLEEAPVLAVSELKEQCYTQMFDGCEKINRITCLATDLSAISRNAINAWVYGVSPTGTFVKKAGVEWPIASYQNNYSGIPSGWTVVEV